MNKSILILGLLISFQILAQDQVKVMYYNLLNFPNSTPERVDTLRKIVQYVKPDLFLVNEIQSNTASNSILTNSLNQWGVNYYQKAAFINGPDTDNMLFYNTQKFGLVSQQVISTVLRDINEYVLYYKDPNISATSDTIYFYMYSLHLKAGTSETAQRNIEITTLTNFLNSRAGIENVFVGGDFNFYTSSEPAYGTLLSSTNVNMKDPLFALGDWNNNSAFAYLHTQSTRTTDLGDGSWGGMDDRFDIIFVSDDVLSGVNGIDYINNTYRGLGQDGLRFNQSINNPTNTLVPDSVANALLYMSDHIPVIMEIDVNYLTNSIEEGEDLTGVTLSYDKAQNVFVLNQELTDFTFVLYSINGKKIMELNLTNTKQISMTKNLIAGVYVWSIENNGRLIKNKIVVE